jgi:glucose-6-phosphate 1-dehydrogenase
VDSAIVILGASGALARRKLIPALLRLCQDGLLEPSTIIIGSGRRAMSHGDFRALFDVPAKFASRLFYHRGISGLKASIANKGNFSKIIVFFALPPQVYSERAAELAMDGFGPETPIIIEKPFGADYASSVELNRRLTEHFEESSLFRIDHYLAKEAVQNILVFRFANPLFFPVWNNQYIESIQINASEKQGVVDRGSYFDSAGILRDMVQNHLMQLLCLTTMEPPLSLESEDIVEKKIELLRCVSIEECHRFQYEGYRGEKDINARSTTETFAELKLRINNFRWAGVPIYMRCGKALERNGTEIAIRFKPFPGGLFEKQGPISRNTIIFMIQPNAGIIVSIVGKEIGREINLVNTNMRFCYDEHRLGEKAKEIPEAYQKLLLDAVLGNHTLFVTARETEISWKVMGDFLDKGEVATYPFGKAPPTRLGVEWIDFENYYSSCS